MPLSNTRSQPLLQDGSSAADSSAARHEDDPGNSVSSTTTALAAHTSLSPPEDPSFTSFPEGEGAAYPDIPSEPMLNKLYNKVLSLTTAGKGASVSTLGQQTEGKGKVDTNEGGTTGIGITLGTTRLSSTPSITSLPSDTTSEVDNAPTQLQLQTPPGEQSEMSANRQSMIKPKDRAFDVLEPVVSPVHAVGGLTRSEDEYSNVDSERMTVESNKPKSTKNMKEISLPGLAGFRLTRESSSDSESVSSYSVHPGRTVKSIIGRLKSGDLGREFWMKDETSHECFLCGEKFTSTALR
jgi:hypothetical protein